MPDTVLECYNFTVDEKHQQQGKERSMQQLEITCRPFNQPTLRYTYGYSDYRWARFVAARLGWVGTLEFAKCEASERPRGALDVMRPAESGWDAIYGWSRDQHTLEEFRRPPGWKYFDEMMPRLLEQYRKVGGEQIGSPW